MSDENTLSVISLAIATVLLISSIPSRTYLRSLFTSLGEAKNIFINLTCDIAGEIKITLAQW